MTYKGLKKLKIAYTQRQVESGRSMVEMLGVLAIIGVLSVAGISAYSTAMAKHRANEAAQQTSIAYIQMMTAASQGRQDSMLLDMEGNSRVTLGSSGTYDNAGIKVDFDDDTAACKQFLNKYDGNSEFHVVGKCD